jgi:hypothetical protein
MRSERTLLTCAVSISSIRFAFRRFFLLRNEK